MPFKSRRHHTLKQNSLRTVLSTLKLIPHHREFRQQIVAINKAVHQSITFQMNGKLEVLRGRRKGFKIIGAILIRRAIETGPVIPQRPRHVRKRRCALENQMLQQVCHARFAITFMPRTNQHCHIDGNCWLRRIRKQQNSRSIRQPIFSHTLYRDHLLRDLTGHSDNHGGQQQHPNGNLPNQEHECP